MQGGSQDAKVDMLLNVLIAATQNASHGSDNCKEERNEGAGGSISGLIIVSVALILATGSCGLPRMFRNIIMRRFSVFSLVCLVILLLAFIIKVSGQVKFIDTYRNYLGDPGFECPCEYVCAHPDWQADVSSEDCSTTNNAFEGGYLCRKKVGRDDCYTEEQCTEGNVEVSCDDSQVDELNAFWVGSLYLDGVEFYHILSSVALLLAMILAAATVGMAPTECMKHVYRICMPILLLTFLCVTLWEVIVEEAVTSSLGEVYTGIPTPCPESNEAKDGGTGTYMNVVATVFAIVFLVLLSLDPAFMRQDWDGERTLCGHVKIYTLLVVACGVIGYLLSYFAIGYWFDELGKKFENAPESYWAFWGVWLLTYSIPIIGMAFTYVYELMCRSGVVVKAQSLGHACYMIEALNVIVMIFAVVVVIITVLVWGLAYCVDYICFYVMSGGRDINGFTPEVCNAARGVYNGSFYGMTMLAPLGLVAGGFCIARTWGVWTTACADEEKDEEHYAENRELFNPQTDYY